MSQNDSESSCIDDFIHSRLPETNQISVNLNQDESISNENESKESLNLKEDDFDEFQAFVATDYKLIESSVENGSHHEQSDFHEDFADFTSFNDESGTIRSEAQSEPHSEFVSTISEKEEEEFENFADFQTSNFQENNTMRSFVFANENCKNLFRKAFSITDYALDNRLISCNLFECKKAENFWANLQQINLKENCIIDRWKKSSSFKHLIEALKIDSRNVISPDVLLKPSQSTSDNDFPLRISTLENYTNGQASTNIENHSEFKPAEIFSNISYPSEKQPIASNCSSQDLDFFESKYINSKDMDSKKIKDDLIAELDEFLMINDEASRSNPNEKIEENIILKTINNIKTVDKLVKRAETQVLSAEALQILSELPNLSMVRAKTLLLPDFSHSSTANKLL
ncbi:Zinc finger protein 26 [Sarcoptes scabiei]|nr:Zinc finger protein 26 [Sarcoptes scabiei]